MEPDISQEMAQLELQEIRAYLRESGEGLEVAEEYVRSLGFPDYRTFVYYAQNGVTPDRDPDQRQAEVGRMGPMRRFGEAMLGGIPFSDEMSGIRMPMGMGPQVAANQQQAAARGLDAGPSYDQGMVDRVRGRRDVLREDYRGATIAAEMIPGLAIPVAGAAGVGRHMAARGASPLISTAVGASAGGAGEGLLFGLGEGEGLGGRLLHGAVGTVAGGVLGGLFGGALGTLGAAGRRIARVGNDIADEKQGRRSAGRWFDRWMKEQDLTPEGVQQRLDELGPEAVVADASPAAGGQQIFAARSLSGGQLDTPGGPAQRLAGRGLERGDRIQRDLMFITDEMGIPVEGKAAQAADRLMDQAQSDFYNPIDVEFGEMNIVTDTPSIWRMLQRDPKLLGEAQEFFGGVQRPLRFNDIQKLRTAMRERLKRMKGDPSAPLGAKEALERRINDLTEAMAADFGDGVRQADDLWRQANGITRAYEAGLQLGGNNSPLTLQRALANEYANLPEQERMALLAGAVDRLGQKIIDSPTGGSAGSKMVNEARAMKEWLGTILGEDGYRQLDNVIQREQAFQTTHQYAGLNSLTGMRNEHIDQMKDAISRPGMRRIEWFWKVADWIADTKALNREKGRAIGEALMAGDTGPMMELLEGTGRGIGGAPRGSGGQAALLAAGLQSPLNRFLLGHYLSNY